jgi:hypothetical protein
MLPSPRSVDPELFDEDVVAAYVRLCEAGELNL